MLSWDSKILFETEDQAELTASLVKADIITEIQGQGHVNTKKLINLIDQVNRSTLQIIQIDIEFEDYYVYIEYGVRPGQIKYMFAKARINALKEWWQDHGLSDKEALSAAYATAWTHKNKEPGLSTEDSIKYADNGRRLHFIDHTIDNNIHLIEFEKTLEDILENAFYSMIDNLPLPFKISKN